MILKTEPGKMISPDSQYILQLLDNTSNLRTKKYEFAYYMTKDFFIAEKIEVGKNKRKYSLDGGVETLQLYIYDLLRKMIRKNQKVVLRENARN